jgi:hypothetical protein
MPTNTTYSDSSPAGQRFESLAGSTIRWKRCHNLPSTMRTTAVPANVVGDQRRDPQGGEASRGVVYALIASSYEEVERIVNAPFEVTTWELDETG